MAETQDKQTLKAVLLDLMASHGLNTVQLSEHIDLPQATLRYILQGHTDNPRIETVIKLADYFEVPVDFLIGRSKSELPKKSTKEGPEPTNAEGIRRIPVLEWKSSRYWCQTPNASVPSTHEDWLPSDESISPKAFGLKINYEGRGTFIKNSFIIVDPDKKYAIDDYVIASLDKNKPTIKRVWEENGKLYLNAVGANLPSEPITADDQVLGTIVETRQSLCD